MIPVILLAIFLISIFSWIFIKRNNSGEKQIGGPFALPLVGNFLSLGKKPYVTFNKWTEQYGKIYEIYFGTQRNIVLSDPGLIRKALNHPNFAGRQSNEVMQFYTNGPKGVANTSGKEWQEQRRFSLRHLRDFGFGKKAMGDLILEEVEDFLQWLSSQEGESLEINKKFNLVTFNGLWRIVTGKRLGSLELEKIYEQLILAGKDPGIMLPLLVPSVAKLFPEQSGWNKCLRILKAEHDLIDKEVDEHRQIFSPEISENPRDFIDAYLAEIARTTDPGSSFYGEYGYKSLNAVVTSFFQAGTHTTASTLTWAILYLTTHLEVQQKLQEEIDQIIGSTRLPSLEDRPRMIYTEAVINEILRKSSIAPRGGHHLATEDTIFEGYEIQKGTGIMGNIHYVHHDPKIWGDPDKFRPERFINSEGVLWMKEYVMGFSVGKRVCLGESLARANIFLFLTGIFQKFHIQGDPNLPTPSIEPVLFFEMLEAPPFSIVVKLRR